MPQTTKLSSVETFFHLPFILYFAAMENNIKLILERLLDRELEPEDGVSEAVITETEQRLGMQLPPVLRAFYQYAGQEETVMDSFQHFAPIEELEIENDKLVFLDENQHVCVWSIAVTDAGNDNAVVYQCPYPDEEWYAEDYDLNAFLEMSLYYQFAQGGCEWVGALDRGMDDEQIAVVLEAAQQWEKVVDHPGNLMIYWHEGTVLWYFPDAEGKVSDNLFASCVNEAAWEEMEETYAFKEL